MATHISRDELLRAVETTARELLEAAGLRSPPVDAFALARQLGIDVARDDRQAGRARYARLANQNAGSASIFLRSDPRRERQQWAVAHELGEHLSPALFDRLNLTPDEVPLGVREQLANQLANQILLPSQWLASIGEATDWDLRRVKERFATASHELIARRMLEVGPVAVMTIVDQGQITWRRGSDGANVPRWLPEECASWQIAHAHVQPLDRATRGGRVRVWPIHEPDWKREIVRLEPIEDFEAGYDETEGEAFIRP